MRAAGDPRHCGAGGAVPAARNEGAEERPDQRRAEPGGARSPRSGGIPVGFLGSRVSSALYPPTRRRRGGASAIADATGDVFEAAIQPVFAKLGDYLNGANGRIKLTPDFGRNAGLADLLHRETAHVLGIQCDNGGCGGKASYSTTGVNAAVEELGCDRGPDRSR